MASAPADALASWYTHEVYVACAGQLAPADLTWVLSTQAEIAEFLSRNTAAILPAVPGPAAIRPAVIGSLDLPAPAPQASNEAAIMLVFLTPGFASGTPEWDEATGFSAAIADGRRSADQLVVCELNQFPDERRATLPWATGSQSGVITPTQLFNPITRVAFSQEDLVREHRWRLINDVVQRLARLRETRAAAVVALAGKPLATKQRTSQPSAVPINQAYLVEYDDHELWTKVQTELTQQPGLVVHPLALATGITGAAQRRQLRVQRQRLLEICQGLLLLRGAASDNLEVMAADALADLRNAYGEAKPICIDWVVDPAPQWPPYFQPEPVDARQPSWGVKVRAILQNDDGMGS